MDLRELVAPIIAAPMAGGPSTPALVAAVGRAGGLGFLAGGYRSPPRLADDIHAVRELTDAPFGVNLFVPTPAPTDASTSTSGAAAVAGYAERLRPAASRAGVELGVPHDDDDGFAEKVELLRRERVPVVSFVFGTPPRAQVDALRSGGASVLLTVTCPQEAAAAEAAGADGVVAQGIEAGGHRGGADDTDDYGMLVLLRLVLRHTRLPVIAAGGLADGVAVGAVLAAGAVAAQLGTAFLRCPEAGTNAVHRQALTSARGTVLTRAFTGRRARALRNDFVTAYDDGHVPSAFPAIHQLTAPLRARSAERGDPEHLHLWAGQGYRLGRDAPAATLVGEYGATARALVAGRG